LIEEFARKKTAQLNVPYV